MGESVSGSAQKARRYFLLWPLFAWLSLPGCAAHGNEPDDELLLSEQGLVDPTFSELPTDGMLPASVAGSLGGTLDVSERGSATYVTQLETPSGRMRLEPSLSLSYDSARGNGHYGVGFALAGGPSAIERCATPNTTDGRLAVSSGQVSFDDLRDSELCWGGTRLVVVQRVNQWGEMELRPLDDPNTRVLAVRTGAEISGVKIEQPSGLILEFTRAVRRPRAVTNASGIRTTTTATFRWLQTQTRDRSGNAILYDYDGADRLREIRYTATVDPASGTVIDAARARRVRFAYEARPDPISRTLGM